jgi:hypothetical protein
MRVDLAAPHRVARDLELVVDQLASFGEEPLARVDVELLVLEDGLVEREHEDAAAKRAANGGEARRGDLLEDRHHEAERAALVALSLGEREAVLEVLLERRVERALLRLPS